MLTKAWLSGIGTKKGPLGQINKIWEKFMVIDSNPIDQNAQLTEQSMVFQTMAVDE